MRKPPDEDWFGSIFTFCVWWGLIAGGVFGYAIADTYSLQMPVLAVLLLLGAAGFRLHWRRVVRRPYPRFHLAQARREVKKLNSLQKTKEVCDVPNGRKRSD